MISLLVSIQPEQVAKIFNREQSVIVRKTAPKEWMDYLDGKTDKKPEPRVAYIFCAKGKGNLIYHRQQGHGEYAVKKETLGFEYNGKVVAKFTLKEVEGIFPADPFDCDKENKSIDPNELMKLSCLTAREIMVYLDADKGYAWHISDLVTFDKPKDLREFRLPNTPSYEQTKPFIEVFGGNYTRENYQTDCERMGFVLKEAPRSWRYVEELT